MTKGAPNMTIEGFLDFVKRRHELQHSSVPTPIGDGIDGASGVKPPPAQPPDGNSPYYKPLLDRPFCFILGAGASVTSGIPSGSALAWQWLEEMHRREDISRGGLQEWATPENLGEEAFEDFTLDRYAEWYPQLFERYFRGNYDFANAYLQDIMKKATASFGYSILAWILARTRHSVVITTNFDNLVADSLFLYAHTSPLVIGHESLARFVRTEPGRPLVCKIHRDLLFDPLNDVDSVSYLRTEWAEALHKLLKRYTPIVIGYGGNDGSLMNFLQHMPTLGADGIFWAYRSQETLPDRIQRLIRKHQGWAVPIYGFDELMVQFAEIFAVGNLHDELQRSAKDTSERYKTAGRALIYRFVDELAEKTTGTERERLFRAAIYHANQSDLKEEWPYWEIHARAASNLNEKEKAYREGIKKLPQSANLLGNYALFLQNVRNDSDEAETFYKRAIEAEPKHANNLSNYAFFLETVRKNPNEAEMFYKRAIEADSKLANLLGNYALFLENVRKDPDAAEIFYKRAIDVNPDFVPNLANYAVFLENVRKDPDAAEIFYKRAIEAGPKAANNLGNYALFLQNVRKDFAGAETFFQRAIEADPSNANTFFNYALFLENVRKNRDEAEINYKRAIEADPNHAPALSGYALLLENSGKDPDQAEVFFKRAIDADPMGANSLGNYALFLQKVLENAGEAEIFFKRAIDADPKHANNLGNYALFLEKVRNNPGEAKIMYERAIKADSQHANNLVNFARFLARNPRYRSKAKALAQETLRISPTNERATELIKILERSDTSSAKNGSKKSDHRRVKKA